VTQSAETFIQINADAQTPSPTGNKVRNIAVVVRQPDGTFQTVYMQAVGVYDPATGLPATFFDEAWQGEVVHLLKRVVKGLEIFIDQDIEVDRDADG
jgi:hypothetical protein